MEIQIVLNVLLILGCWSLLMWGFQSLEACVDGDLTGGWTQWSPEPPSNPYHSVTTGKVLMYKLQENMVVLNTHRVSTLLLSPPCPHLPLAEVLFLPQGCSVVSLPKGNKIPSTFSPHLPQSRVSLFVKARKRANWLGMIKSFQIREKESRC